MGHCEKGIMLKLNSNTNQEIALHNIMLHLHIFGTHLVKGNVQIDSDQNILSLQIHFFSQTFDIEFGSGHWRSVEKSAVKLTASGDAVEEAAGSGSQHGDDRQ